MNSSTNQVPSIITATLVAHQGRSRSQSAPAVPQFAGFGGGQLSAGQ